MSKYIYKNLVIDCNFLPTSILNFFKIILLFLDNCRLEYSCAHLTNKVQL